MAEAGDGGDFPMMIHGTSYGRILFGASLQMYSLKSNNSRGY